MSPKNKANSDTVELMTSSMGGQGDAIAEWRGKRVFVPLALPGERMRAVLRSAAGGDLVGIDVEILAASPERITPACRHFGSCGGCALQHWAEPSYREWKIRLLRQALRHRALDLPERLECVFVPAATRRRAEFAALKRSGQVQLGFHARGSDAIVDQDECPILSPALARLVGPLRQVLRDVLRENEPADILATETSTGIDLLISAEEAPNAAQRAILAGFADHGNVARIGWQTRRGAPEPVVLLRLPQMQFGTATVDLPMP